MEVQMEMELHARLVTIDGDGQLHPPDGDPIDLITDEVQAVLVLWNRDDSLAWKGWLRTGSRRSISFTAADLGEPIFQNWLRSLPGWKHEQLWHATTNPGHHLVWQRSRE